VLWLFPDVTWSGPIVRANYPRIAAAQGGGCASVGVLYGVCGGCGGCLERDPLLLGVVSGQEGECSGGRMDYQNWWPIWASLFESETNGRSCFFFFFFFFCVSYCSHLSLQVE
jgi:hypothetical protein